MRTELRVLLVCSLLLITGMRDPFRPPDDRCATGALGQWRYQGMLKGGSAVGMVKDEQQRWHRVRLEERLPAGWQVLAVNETEMVIGLGEGCEPKEWRWPREGTKHENSQSNRPVDDTQHADMGRRAKTRHPGGG
ncbi:HofP DNA utilization family protein [Lelliottia sp. JS-SCA-14]|uniref:HofP DNA utilization family protein n=1 Tax=Lelliottia sp. JS-SCA-14 TaxID=3110110 RepID=UPI002D793899|nr:HofP DNA utilization family protein [Lelliottia sp. JS-SCA-14]